MCGIAISRKNKFLYSTYIPQNSDRLNIKNRIMLYYISMKQSIYSIGISIIYIPITFLVIFIFPFVFLFIEQYIWPLMLGVDRSGSWSWWTQIVNSTIVAFFCGSLSAVSISFFYKNYNLYVFIVPLFFTLITVILELLDKGLSIEGIGNSIFMIVIFVVFKFSLSNQS